MLAAPVLSRICRRLPQYAHRPLARHIFSSPPHRAIEFPNFNAEAAEAVQGSPVFQKLSKHQPAMEAMQKFAELMQKLGVEAGKQPSTLQMMKLVANSEFREASKNMAEEFKKAGVDLSSPDVVQEMQSIAKLFAAPKGS